MPIHGLFVIQRFTLIDISQDKIQKQIYFAKYYQDYSNPHILIKQKMEI